MTSLQTNPAFKNSELRLSETIDTWRDQIRQEGMEQGMQLSIPQLQSIIQNSLSAESIEDIFNLTEA
ncbi:MAG: hypothetical protein U1E78_03045 [Gammaproteobacteria bacterium]